MQVTIHCVATQLPLLMQSIQRRKVMQLAVFLYTSNLSLLKLCNFFITTYLYSKTHYLYRPFMIKKMLYQHYAKPNKIEPYISQGNHLYLRVTVIRPNQTSIHTFYEVITSGQTDLQHLLHVQMNAISLYISRRKGTCPSALVDFGGNVIMIVLFWSC